MAGGARMACQGLLGLRDTKVTWEKPAALEPQVKSLFLVFDTADLRKIHEIPGLSSSFPNGSF